MNISGSQLGKDQEDDQTKDGCTVLSRICDKPVYGNTAGRKRMTGMLQTDNSGETYSGGIHD